ncbi:hypothetical protein Taro_052495 [Colocasia esculenta]|uniref:Uncharacterized protein n=1 Tax=Colocasia esculenta TaxID=4460 RepID=A0A843XK21_COLES|nr:hypothetical protein [Colocasia esculenta]
MLKKKPANFQTFNSTVSIEETSYLSSEFAPTYRPLLPGPMIGLLFPSMQGLPPPSMKGSFIAFPPPSPPFVDSSSCSESLGQKFLEWMIEEIRVVEEMIQRKVLSICLRGFGKASRIFGRGWISRHRYHRLHCHLGMERLLWFGIPCEASARSQEADSDQRMLCVCVMNVMNACNEDDKRSKEEKGGRRCGLLRRQLEEVDGVDEAPPVAPQWNEEDAPKSKDEGVEGLELTSLLLSFGTRVSDPARHRLKPRFPRQSGRASPRLIEESHFEALRCNMKFARYVAKMACLQLPRLGVRFARK